MNVPRSICFCQIIGRGKGTAQISKPKLSPVLFLEQWMEDQAFLFVNQALINLKGIGWPLCISSRLIGWKSGSLSHAVEGSGDTGSVRMPRIQIAPSEVYELWTMSWGQRKTEKCLHPAARIHAGHSGEWLGIQMVALPAAQPVSLVACTTNFLGKN